MIVENLNDAVVEDSGQSASLGDLSNKTLEASTKILSVLNTMLANVSEGEGSISVADLKDITSMIKDVSMQIDKLSKNSGSRSEGLGSYLARLKA